MTHQSTSQPKGEELALLVCEEGRAEQTLASFTKLILNYKYGLVIEQIADPGEAQAVFRHKGGSIRCALVIQQRPITTGSAISELTANGQIPLFLILPHRLASEQERSCEGLENVIICPWEAVFTSGPDSLQQMLFTHLRQDNDLFSAEGDDRARLEVRVSERLNSMDTLPTVPSIVTHIMRLINNPNTTVKELEGLLSSDPAIVLKVVQVANSAVFSGSSSNRRSTLNEAVVRLGLRKIGAIGQQIALINSFVRPDDSHFDMLRFWQHSMGCALLAEKLVDGGHVRLAPRVEFNEYWIGALLHDSGKLIQGLFFWEWFERILDTMERDDCSFHRAETELIGGTVSHGFIGGLLMRKSQMPNSITHAVRLHHATGAAPEALTSLIHVADNLANEIGLGYTENVAVEYQRSALDRIKLSVTDVPRLKETYGPTVVEEVKQLVDQCMS